jgi:RHS repeat-associated protein
VTNGSVSYPLNDHLGSAYMVAEQDGWIAKTFNYTPFGESIGNDPGSNNSQGFTGHIEDETGLTYMQARYYDPVIGRFLSADPIGYADGLNIYAYVRNDPLNKIDPTGLAGTESSVPPQPPPPPPPPSPPEPTGPYAEDGVTLLPVKDGPYVDGDQKTVRDTTGAGDKAQEAVDAIDENKVQNDIATGAKARGDKETQEHAEYEAARQMKRYESLIDQPNRPPLVIHPDGSVGGAPQEGDVKVPQ